MSSATGDAAARIEHLQNRLRPALRRVVFLVVPSAVAFVSIGGSVVALLFQTGRVSASDTTIVWIVLAGSALGLSAGTQGRLLGSAFYALGDAKSPLRAALVRVVITGAAGWAFALPVRDWLRLLADVGRVRAHRQRRLRRMDRVLAAAALARRADRQGPDPDAARPRRARRGARRRRARLRRVTSRARAHASHTWPVSLVAIAVFGITYLGIMAAANAPRGRRLRAQDPAPSSRRRGGRCAGARLGQPSHRSFTTLHRPPRSRPHFQLLRGTRAIGRLSNFDTVPTHGAACSP